MYFNYDFRQLPMSQTTPTQPMSPTSPTQPIASTGGTSVDTGGSVEQDINYTQGWLRTQIGKKVNITFLLGTDSIQDRTGVLLRVGISYIIIRETDTDDQLLCDIYSIKFVRVYH